MLVQDGLQNNAARRPDKTALVCDGRRLSYADLDSAADRLANALAESGVRRGDRVAVYLPNGVEAVISIFGVLKAGAVFVVLNPSTKFDKLSYILGDCGASALIAQGRLAADGGLERLRAKHAGLRMCVLTGPVSGETAAANGAVEFEAIRRNVGAARLRTGAIDLDLACLVYTSGSTGEPKGVMSDHSNVVFAASSIISYLENTERDVVIDVLPLSFDYGLYQLLMTTMFGGTLVLESGFAFPSQTLARIEQERATGFPGVPTIFATLLQMDISGFELSSLRYITNTAAALPASHIRDLRSKFPGVAIYSMYGLTETKRTLYLPPEQLDCRPESVGIAIPGTEVWTVDPAGRRVGANEIGELVVRGRHVMRGYWNDAAGTAERFRPGPLPGERLCFTGDLFRIDPEGYCYFVGRKDDIIKCRGEKISPREVENVLHSIPGVYEASVFGVPDPVLGQAVKAALVADVSRVTEKAVLAHCRAHLEDFMVPKYVEFRDELPKTASGKVSKRALAICAGLQE